MIMPLFLFDNSYLNIVTITFTALILTEYLNIFSEVVFSLLFIAFILVEYMSYCYDHLLNTFFTYLYFLHSFFKIIA